MENVIWVDNRREYAIVDKFGLLEDRVKKLEKAAKKKKKRKIYIKRVEI